MSANQLSNEQLAAMKKTPSCVELDDWDGTWDHVVYRVEHPVIMFTEGQDSYTKREAKSCLTWLKKYAPTSNYAKADL